MSGYIYITGHGADPALDEHINDPLFTDVPTLGACMPNIRRAVSLGDWIFVISGKRPIVQQYIVGGLRVAEKIDALAALERFPQNRLRILNNGKLAGNIIVDEKGNRSPLDTHRSDTFEKRIKNYIVGSESVSITEKKEVERSRDETLPLLSELAGKPGANRVIDAIGRLRKLDDMQTEKLLGWLKGIKSPPS
jgi:hypothetical protein